MDAATQKIALLILGLIALAVVIGGLVLTNNDKTLPDALLALGSVAVGAIAGIITTKAISANG